MRRTLLLAALAAGALTVRADLMNARIRFEDSATVSQAGKSLCLKTTVVQTERDFLVLEPGDFTVFQPANPKARVFDAEGSLSHAALVHMKELGWRFEIVEPGEYEVWMRSLFPLAAGYNHGERMDDGEAANVVDSADGLKIDKFGPLPSPSQMADKWLEPNAWHWYPNKTYALGRGSHFLHFPPNGAWCGGCLLDRIVLVRKGATVRAEAASPAARRVIRPASGEIVSRRIKTARIAKWTLEADFEKGGGDVAFAYSYGGEDWTAFAPGEVQPVADGSDYLYIRIRLTAAVSDIQPYMSGYRFRVEKKEVK